MNTIANARKAVAIASVVAASACITNPPLNAFIDAKFPSEVAAASTYDVTVRGIGTEGVRVGYIMLITDAPQGGGKDTTRVTGDYLQKQVRALNQPGAQALQVIIGGNRLPTKTGHYNVPVR